MKMENQLKFGTVEMSYFDNQESSWVSYTAPSVLPPEMLKKANFAGGPVLITPDFESPKVTHKVFFGENIKRVIAAFKK